MKLSSRKQLTKEAARELQRLRKLAGLRESNSSVKAFLFEDFIDVSDADGMTREEFQNFAVQALADQLEQIFNTMIHNIKQGKNSAGVPIPKAVDKKKAIEMMEKEKQFVIAKVKSEKLKSMDSLMKYFVVDLSKKMKDLGFEV